jgi:hypothetical protein
MSEEGKKEEKVDDKKDEKKIEGTEPGSLIPKQGHQVMLAAQSLFFRKLILEHKKAEFEKKQKKE